MNSSAVPNISNLDNLEFLRSIISIKEKRDTLCKSKRLLNKNEITRLEAQGNSAQDWASINVCDGFSPDYIRNTSFFGTCYIGIFSGKSVNVDSALSLPSGIYNSVISNTVIGNECCVWNAKAVHNYYIENRVVLFNIGTLTCNATSTFGNGREIVIGMETGGREIRSFADITIGLAYKLCTQRKLISSYNEFIAEYSKRVCTGYGVIESESRICNCPQIIDAYIGSGVNCNNVTLLQNTTILSSTREPTNLCDGIIIRNSCIQWGNVIASMAIVDNAVLTEYAHVEKHGKVTHSIIGPNTGIAEGEVTASLVGPFVGFHHQALLIGALWPNGKGNVAYGANVGSNHTAKAPDQEIYCGEGLFFGLGVNIKFPADFSRSPYSIIATNVSTLPQRISFPFSLINTPSRHFDEIPQPYNELTPGWVLSDNLYTVMRNEGKFLKRNKARRSDFSADVFRPDIIDLMLLARNLLRDAGVVKEFYLESDIPGVGKNFITRQSLLKGQNTYSQHIEHYCLSGLFQQCSMLLQNNVAVTENAILTTMPNNPYWKHQLQLCTSEGFFNRSLRDNFERLATLVTLSAQSVLSAKEKDDIRGRKIMSDYDLVHTSAKEDGFVKDSLDKSKTMKQEIYLVMEQLKAH